MGTRLLYSLLTSCPMVSVGAHEKSRVQNLHLVHARRGRGSGVTSPETLASFPGLTQWKGRCWVDVGKCGTSGSGSAIMIAGLP